MKVTRNSKSSMSKNEPLRYYRQNALSYVEATVAIDMSAVYDRFLKYVVRGGLILDAGSGSGRDTLAFLRRGYQVEAFDASQELCEFSTRITGVKTSCIRFQDFNSPPKYDGIWACASLLHVPLAELDDVVRHLVRALKSSGAFYLSFRYGTKERIAADGRHFTDMDEDATRRLLNAIPDLTIAEIWRSGGEGVHHGKDFWLNAIALVNRKHLVA